MKKYNTKISKKLVLKKWRLGVFIVMAIIGTGCSNSKMEETAAAAESTEASFASKETFTENATAGVPDSAEFEVMVNAAGHKDGNNVVFDIDTNLPDETVLMLALTKGDFNTDDHFIAQTKVTISDGKAISEGFSNKGDSLTGEYDLCISMSLPKLQSDAVRAVIGENGERMMGSLVEVSSVGNANVINAVFSVSTDGDVVVTPTDDYTHTIYREESEDTEVAATEASDHTADNAQANKEFIEKYDNEIVSAAKMTLDNFLSDYDMSLAPQRWTLAKFDDQNAVIGMTDITFNGQKGQYIYIGTLNFDTSGKVVSANPHYVEALGQVLGNDGYCDDVFDVLKQLSESKAE